MDMQLSGKVALITGSSAGIGLAIAQRLAMEGARVVICGRSKEKLDAAVAAIGQNALPIMADPSSAGGAQALTSQVPNVDILVNNLGIYESKQFADISDEDWRNYFEVNVLSGARLARHYLPRMLAADWGRIIFISSDSALVIPPDMIHYGMTKTAQLAISRGLAGLTKGSRVTVNSVLPGTTRSAGIEKFMRSVISDPTLSQRQMEQDYFAKERPTSLAQRIIEPSEIATLVAYLASPLSSATNGAVFRADGGITPTVV